MAYESQQAAAARNQVGPVGLRVEGVLGPQGCIRGFSTSERRDRLRLEV